MLRPLSFALALAALTMSSVAGAEPGQASQVPGAGAPATMTMSCMDTMMKMHARMMTEMIANDVKLDALVTDMNAAEGDARIEALRATVNELVRQYRAERVHMRDMHESMMHAPAAAADAGAAPHVH